MPTTTRQDGPVAKRPGAGRAPRAVLPRGGAGGGTPTRDVALAGLAGLLGLVAAAAVACDGGALVGPDPEASGRTCHDGVDNDDDGLTDCLDPACGPYCTPTDLPDAPRLEDATAPPDAPAPPCDDEDGDGYGPDCPLGLDCDDLSAHCAKDCESDTNSNGLRDCDEAWHCEDEDDDGYGVGAGCAGPDCNDAYATCTTTCVDADADGIQDCHDGCLDVDRDGRGVGCAAGSDCDDAVAACAADCRDANGNGMADCGEDCPFLARNGLDTRVSVSDEHSYGPSVTWTGTQYGIAWVEAGEGARFRRLDANGAPAGGVVAVPGLGYVTALDLVADGTGFALAYVDDSTVYFQRISSSGGLTGTPVPVSGLMSVTGLPSLVKRADRFGLAWLDYSPGGDALWFAELGATGTVTAGPGPIDTGAHDVLGFSRPVWTGSSYAIAWIDTDATYTSTDGYLTRFTADGARLGANAALSATHGALYPSLTWSGDDLVVLWSDETSVGLRPYLARYAATGARQSGPTRIAATSSVEHLASRSIRSGDRHAAAWSVSGSAPVLVAVVPPDTAAVSGDLLLGEGDAELGPSLVAAGERLAVAWSDDRGFHEGSFDREEVYFARLGCQATAPPSDARDAFEANDTAPGFWLGDVSSEAGPRALGGTLHPAGDQDRFFFYLEPPLLAGLCLQVDLSSLPLDGDLEVYRCTSDTERGPTPACATWTLVGSSRRAGTSAESVRIAEGLFYPGRRYMVRVFPYLSSSAAAARYALTISTNGRCP